MAMRLASNEYDQPQAYTQWPRAIPSLQLKNPRVQVSGATPGSGNGTLRKCDTATIDARQVHA